MIRDAPAPLFHPFETGDVDMPAPEASVVFLGAKPGLRLPLEFPKSVAMVQGSRPDFLALQRAGNLVSPFPQSNNYDLALVLASRHRGESEARLAEAIQRVRPGGLIIMAGGKTEGISSLRKRLAQEFFLEGHVSKNHGEAFWFLLGGDATRWADATAAAHANAPQVEGRFLAAPGMFSHDRIDIGSQVLADNLPTKLNGRAADFCAGWGYLSVALAARASGITGVDLFEADFASLEAARVNMARLVPNLSVGFHWLDLTAEKVERGYDVIVMNPPFHQGRAAEPGIGHAMIRAASNALKPGGQLFMVANRGLPYEPALKAGFARAEELADTNGFKVWKAKR